MIDISSDEYFWVNYVLAAILFSAALAWTCIVFWIIFNCEAVPPPIWPPQGGSPGGGFDFPFYFFL